MRSVPGGGRSSFQPGQSKVDLFSVARKASTSSVGFGGDKGLPNDPFQRKRKTSNPFEDAKKGVRQMSMPQRRSSATLGGDDKGIVPGVRPNQTRTPFGNGEGRGPAMPRRGPSIKSPVRPGGMKSLRPPGNNGMMPPAVNDPFNTPKASPMVMPRGKAPLQPRPPGTLPGMKGGAGFKSGPGLKPGGPAVRPAPPGGRSPVPLRPTPAGARKNQVAPSMGKSPSGPRKMVKPPADPFNKLAGSAGYKSGAGFKSGGPTGPSFGKKPSGSIMPGGPGKKPSGPIMPGGPGKKSSIIPGGPTGNRLGKKPSGSIIPPPK